MLRFDEQKLHEKISFNYLPFKSKEYLHVLKKQVFQVLERGVFFASQEVTQFEENLQNFFDVRHAVTVGSGHDALVLALRGLHLQKNDEVILQANAYPTAFALAELPCRVRLVDCDVFGQIDITDVAKKISAKTKAIIVVHLYGACCDMTKLLALASQADVPVIEDCAQCFGSTWQGKKLGTFGLAGCLSFYPTKNLGAAGDGGAIITDNDEVSDFCLQAKQYGEKDRYHSGFVSGHSRLSEIQAAVLNVYFSSFEADSQKKRKRSRWYDVALKQSPVNKFVRHLQPAHSDLIADDHLFVAEVPDRVALQKFLAEQKIETAVHYPVPIHLTNAFHFLDHEPGDFPVAEKLSQGIISLPYHQYLRKTHVQRVVHALETFYAV